ncbi:iron-containing alcohol dehydrogenase [Desulfurivibrio alkaliphilus]|uniref:Iron-containing alcohol dehydrogenase n=1 Tax=Desulfurivibrio alkaliphilus (strain DSM 19089 / UNIQEM U267 / AHT2) TaxID=589865 RepID=D6Z274_DESAT|nr:iron-containing alcohol dehydrogenase [Desulfurivibrio alkaliphilus]ADH85649.1 iron-containing alcohol dehydrogenase [Desulfurivibrio alkaliphilus AHT 2]
MRENNFTVTQPTRIRFGVDSINDLAAMVRELGGSRVLLVIDPGVAAAGLLEKVGASLKGQKVPFTVYDQVAPEPGLKLADAGAKLAKQKKCDCVVGVGGGSAMDVAKAVSILLTNGGKAEDYIGLGKIAKAGVPKIMIPTTAGTGAEMTFTAVFINEKTGSKAGMNGDPLYPEAAILDPALTLSMPSQVTAATGIDALTHALEAYVSTQAHTISDMYALEAIDLIAGNLGKAYAHGDNLEARSAMLMGSLLAGKALATAGVGLVHAMAYPLGGMHQIPHGLANAVLLPYVMAYNLIGAPERFATLAEMFGVDTSELNLREAAQASVEAVWNLNQDVGIPRSLQELGIPREDIPEMAKIALTVARPVANNPRRPNHDEVMAIYEEALVGWE